MKVKITKTKKKQKKREKEKMFKNAFLLLLFVFGVCQLQSLPGPEIVFDKPDINATANYNTGPVYVEAYKSKENDHILKEGDQSKYGELSWYSMGAPKLFKTLCPSANKKFLFHMSSRGFHTFADSLKLGHRHYLALQASAKYSPVAVSPNHIKSLPVSRIDCRIYFNDTTTGRTYLIKGNASNIESGMPRLTFRAPSNTNERVAFEKRDNSSKPLKVECQYWSGEVSVYE